MIGCGSFFSGVYRVEFSCSISPANSSAFNTHRINTSPCWLQEVLAPKIMKWMQLPDLNTSTNTLRLVDFVRYNQLYISLKKKYGDDLVKVTLYIVIYSIIVSLIVWLVDVVVTGMLFTYISVVVCQ